MEADLLTREFDKKPAQPETPPPARKPVIAVDGFAASGKGTLARAVAKELGFAYLDTGAIYRSVTLATLKMGGDPAKVEDVRKVLDVVKNNITPALLADPELRAPEVADAVPLVAAMPEVREAVRAYQEEFMKNPPGNAAGAVLDGRDIGTVVCPDAEVKLFVTAAPDERARRRWLELKDGHPELTYDKVLDEINARDNADMHRAVSPLVQAADAHELDTTSLTPDEALAAAMKIIRAKIPPSGPANGSSKFASGIKKS